MSRYAMVQGCAMATMDNQLPMREAMLVRCAIHVAGSE